MRTHYVRNATLNLNLNLSKKVPFFHKALKRKKNPTSSN